MWNFSFSVPIAAASLSIAKSHSGNFTQGQQDAEYTIAVSNASNAAPTSGTVTVTENPPSGLSLFSLSGTGWTCSGSKCSRGDALASGSSYPAITAAVTVAASATSPQVNQVSVSGGGSSSASASDSTTIETNAAINNGPTLTGISPTSGPPLTLLSLSGSFDPSNTLWVNFTAQGGYSVSIPAIGVTPTSAAVAVPVFQNGSGSLFNGAVSIQALTAIGGKTGSVSFNLTGLPPASPLPSGTLTLGFLQGEVSALQSFRQSIQGTATDTADFETAYNDSLNAAGSLTSAIQSLMNGAGSVDIATFNGNTVTVTPSDLSSADALLLNEVKLSSQLTGSAQSSPAAVFSADASATTIQQSAADLYTLGSTTGSSASSIATATANFVSASSNGGDSNFNGNTNLWVSAGFGVGQFVECAACGSSTIDGSVYASYLFYAALVDQESVTSDLSADPLIGGAFNNENQMLQEPNSVPLGGPAGNLNKGAGELQKNASKSFCSKAPCGVYGTTIQLFVQDNAVPPSISSVQVCATYPGQTSDNCGPANVGFGVNQPGGIVIWANPGTVYTLTLPPQPAAAYCFKIQDGTGMAGTNNPVAIIDCN